MTRKVKYNKDNSVTVTLNGRDNDSFWVAVDKETKNWINAGYVLVDAVKGGGTFQDGILTSFLNIFRTILGMSEKHDPVVKLIFTK